MLTRKQVETIKQESADWMLKSGIVLTAEERDRLEIADFGLSDFNETGLVLHVYVNTERVCAKELVMYPHQTCPEHFHPKISESNPGKEETFRCRAGKVFLYVPGPRSPQPQAVIPKGQEVYYTVWHEIVLNPGDQYTLRPNIKHWFQAGPDGAIVTEFSTTSLDQFDQFTHPDIQRFTTIVD